MSRIFATTIQYSQEDMYKKHLLLNKFGKVERNAIGRVPNCVEFIDDKDKACFLDDIYVVIDGNLTNRKELVGLLDEKSDVRDCELIAKLYRSRKTDLLYFINGNYSIVLYDAKIGKLFGIRDRLGNKPLFYHYSKNGIELCSQLFPICIGNKFDINSEARKLYWIMQHIPEPYSIISQISKLEAGCYFEYDLPENSLAVHRYWDVTYNTNRYQIPESFGEARNVADTLIRDSVKSNLLPDGKVAVYLSGGIDSSLIALYLKKLDANVQSLSISFDIPNFNETEYAAKVARQLEIPFSDIRMSANNFSEIIDDISYYYDEPMGDPSAIPTCFINKQAGGAFDQAFGGDGGDEFFLGYRRYRYAQLRHKYPVFFIPAALALYKLKLRDYGVRFGQKSDVDYILHLLLGEKIAPFINYDPDHLLKSIEAIEYLTNQKELSKGFSNFEIKTNCQYAYGVKTERASNRYGVDFRGPILDYKVLEYSRCIPDKYLYSFYEQKLVLRKILYDHVDKTLFERAKRGFSCPIGFWLRNELKEYLFDTINEDALAGIEELNINSVLNMRDQHCNGTVDYADVLWRLIHYTLWYRTYIKLNQDFNSNL